MLPAAAALSCAALAPLALAQDGPPPGWVGPAPGWSGGVLIGAAAVPEFEGSRHTRVQPVLGGEVYWRPGVGASVAMGSRGLVWTPWQTTAGSASLGLSVDPGRVDDDERKLTPAGLRPGSADLRGMGEVKMTALVSASGSLALGPVSLTGALRQAVASHRGTLVEAGLALPWQLHRHAKLTLTPGVTWADRRHMQAYFGVTPQQSAASGYAPFDAGAGVKSQQLVLDFDMAFSRHWHLQALLRAQRLSGDAADSPITQRTRQASGLLALRYEFQL
jgi:outer membrane scaffolding protein for murein synthesis (MipA/OmpV family)